MRHAALRLRMEERLRKIHPKPGKNQYEHINKKTQQRFVIITTIANTEKYVCVYIYSTHEKKADNDSNRNYQTSE